MEYLVSPRINTLILSSVRSKILIKSLNKIDNLPIAGASTFYYINCSSKNATILSKPQILDDFLVFAWNDLVVKPSKTYALVVHLCVCVSVEERCWRHPFHEHFFCWRRSSAPLRWLKKKGNQVTYLYMHTGPIHAQSTYSCIIINIDIWEYPRYTRHTMSAQPNKRPFIVKVRFMSKKGKLLSAPHIWDVKITTYTQIYYDDAYYNTESIWSFMHRVVDQCFVPICSIETKSEIRKRHTILMKNKHVEYHTRTHKYSMYVH